MARDDQVSILCLPAHATHFLQPLDVAVFKPVKTCWAKGIENYYSINNNDSVKKDDFASLSRGKKMCCKRIFIKPCIIIKTQL